MLTPTLLPNLLLATRTALFPANARPTSQIPAGHTGAPTSGPPYAQTPAPSQKPLAPVASPGPPIAEGVKGPSASNTVGKPHNPGNSSNNSGVPASTTTTSNPSTLSASTTADAPTTPLINDTAEPEERKSPSDTEIAAIKRRCAANLLAVIPRSVARAFLGVPSSAPPPPYNDDGTCSFNRSPSPATSSPPSLEDNHGSSLQEGKANLASSHSPSITRPVASEGLAAERLRTDDDPSAGIDTEELYLLETIENDFLDLFADEYCNKHLVFAIIETVLARILPEMAERSVGDLLEDRGVALVPPAF